MCKQAGRLLLALQAHTHPSCPGRLPYTNLAPLSSGLQAGLANQEHQAVVEREGGLLGSSPLHWLSKVSDCDPLLRGSAPGSCPSGQLPRPWVLACDNGASWVLCCTCMFPIASPESRNIPFIKLSSNCSVSPSLGNVSKCTPGYNVHSRFLFFFS